MKEIVWIFVYTREVNETPHMIEDMTDEMLVLKLRTHPQFLGTLIERYETVLSRYIRRKSHASNDDIKDILQNVFIKVYKNMYDFDTTLSFSSWIYRIARNEMIDWYRKEKIRPHVSLEANDTLVYTLASESDIVHEALAEETKRELKEVIEKLPEKYREIVELRFYEEKSYDEIADILAIPPGTVAVRINRVKGLLKEKLEHLKKNL